MVYIVSAAGAVVWVACLLKCSPLSAGYRGTSPYLSGKPTYQELTNSKPFQEFRARSVVPSFRPMNPIFLDAFGPIAYARLEHTHQRISSRPRFAAFLLLLAAVAAPNSLLKKLDLGVSQL